MEDLFEQGLIASTVPIESFNVVGFHVRILQGTETICEVCNQPRNMLLLEFEVDGRYVVLAMPVLEDFFEFPGCEHR